MSQNAIRPPTPVGWSDTDWLKYLHEQNKCNVYEESPHPLDGLHINKGSFDALADLYEAEYNKWKRKD